MSRKNWSEDCDRYRKSAPRKMMGIDSEDADLGSTRGRRQRRAESADGGRPDPGGGEAVLKIKINIRQ